MGLISNGSTVFDAGAKASGFGGAMVFIKKLTASSSGTLSFVNGSSSVVLNNTYKEYVFIFQDIHPATNDAIFQFGFRDGSTAYDATKTSTYFYATHKEDGSQALIAYETSYDQAQSTSFHNFNNTGNENDESITGILRLFNPASTTFVKHFETRFVMNGSGSQMSDSFVAGYCNVTAAIDAVQFKFSSGNIDAGTISLYGIA